MGWLQWEFRPVYPKVCGPLPPMGGEGREEQGVGEVAGGECRLCLQWELKAHVTWIGTSAPRSNGSVGKGGGNFGKLEVP